MSKNKEQTLLLSDPKKTVIMKTHPHFLEGPGNTLSTGVKATQIKGYVENSDKIVVNSHHEEIDDCSGTLLFKRQASQCMSPPPNKPSKDVQTRMVWKQEELGALVPHPPNVKIPFENTALTPPLPTSHTASWRKQLPRPRLLILGTIAVFSIVLINVVFSESGNANTERTPTTSHKKTNKKTNSIRATLSESPHKPAESPPTLQSTALLTKERATQTKEATPLKTTKPSAQNGTSASTEGIQPGNPLSQAAQLVLDGRLEEALIAYDTLARTTGLSSGAEAMRTILKQKVTQQ